MEGIVSAVKASNDLKQGRNFETLVTKPFGGIEAVKIIRGGFNAHMLKSASGYLGVPEKRILDVVHVPTATAHRLQKNNQNVDPGVAERLYRMGIVTRMAIDVFEDPELAKEWLRRPNRGLANEAPLDLLDTEPGGWS
jgi:putative toxin-antitoxin system antitoxin component (TIGR02293 family)